MSSHENIRPLYSQEQIAERTAALGMQITKDYQDSGEELVLVGILKGSVMFFADLAR